MTKKYNKNLKEITTMKIDAECNGIIPIYFEQNIYEILVKGLSPIKVLGGGSNVLITKNQGGYILKNEIKGIEIVDEDDQQILVNVGAGEIWHNFVLWAIAHRLGGIENLALIPGTVGAAPIQNIGAYGVDQSGTFHSLRAIDMKTGVTKVFFKNEVKFGYRDSIFKHDPYRHFFITRVSYLLKKNPKINIEYGGIKDKLKEKNIINPTINDVVTAVIEIRKSKLPNPQYLPNCGSFFKNPLLDQDTFESLKEVHPDIPYYPAGKHIKIPAAWLIEQCGWKGFRDRDAGVYEHHALILVNHGNATGKEMTQLYQKIQQSVKEKFKIDLTPEVNIW